MAEADYRLMTEATGQRIAAALEALHLATVTGVKGNAEGAYQHGDVNITPANIGAVAKTGDTMTGPLTIDGELKATFLSSTASINPEVLFKKANGTTIAAIYAISSNQRMLFREFAPNSDYYEDYDLPAPTTTEANRNYKILTTKNPAQARASLGIVAGTKASVFSSGAASFPPSEIGLTGKPNTLILTLSSNEASNPPTYDTFLSYDWNASTDSMITVHGYKGSGTPIAGYIRYSYIAIP